MKEDILLILLLLSIYSIIEDTCGSFCILWTMSKRKISWLSLQEPIECLLMDWNLWNFWYKGIQIRRIFLLPIPVLMFCCYLSMKIERSLRRILNWFWSIIKDSDSFDKWCLKISTNSIKLVAIKFCITFRAFGMGRNRQGCMHNEGNGYFSYFFLMKKGYFTYFQSYKKRQYFE